IEKRTSSKPWKRSGTLSKYGCGSCPMTWFSVTRKYNSTAFFSHRLTRQPPLAFGSATRRLPLSSRASASSQAGRRFFSMRVRVSVARRSQARSIVCSSDDIGSLGRRRRRFVDGARKRRAKRSLLCIGQRAIDLVGYLEEVLDALAERRDARI